MIINGPVSKDKICAFDTSSTPKHKKVIAVAIATLVLLGCQLSMCWPVTLLATLFVTVLTHLSEQYVRTESNGQNDWFNTDFDKRQIAFLSAFFLLRHLIIQVVCWCLGLPLPLPPQEGLVSLLLTRPWQTIPVATIQAPIVEEIFFRGFLLERFEDLIRNVSVLSAETKQKICNIAQAILFGVLHLRAKITEGFRVFVLVATSNIGYLAGNQKQEEKGSLLPSIAMHAVTTPLVKQVTQAA